MSRAKKTIRNLKVEVIFQIVGLFISMVVRTVFIQYLGKDLLGLSGLYTNIVTLLSIAELGIGSSITFALYEPISKQKYGLVLAILRTVKKFYISVSLVILVAGMTLIPFLHLVIEELVSIEYYLHYYILFLMNSCISYLMVYKQHLIIADQKLYQVTKIIQLFEITTKLLQLVVLVVSQSYMIFLSIRIITTILKNIYISKHADTSYKYLQDKSDIKIPDETKAHIIKNIKGNISHKLGSVVVNATDNIVLSTFVGLATVGIYSNYLMIIGFLNKFSSMIFNASRASIGNLNVTEDRNSNYCVFNQLYLLTTWMFGFISISLLSLFNPFIQLWLGDSFLLNDMTVLVIVVNLYITGMRKPIILFTETMGLFWFGRYKPIFESIINLIVSIILVKYLGILGVLLGTLTSLITTCLWVEPRVLFKYGFKMGVANYFYKYVKYLLVNITIGILTMRLVMITYSGNIKSFVLSCFVVAILPNLLLLLAYYRNENFKLLLERVGRKK